MTENKQIMKSLSIYIHIPFCIRKCNYCDFLSAPADSRTQEVYLCALKEEIRANRNTYKDYVVKTVFIGGGTPTAVAPSLLCEVIAELFTCFQVDPDAEISMEANPGTVSKEALLSYKSAGVNRLSIGLQSADNEELKLLGRIHTYEDFLQTYEWAVMAGFTNINLDLMSALPEQSVERFKQTLFTVLKLNPIPTHISAYSLIVEEGTAFYEQYGEESKRLMMTGEKQPHLPSEEEERQMYAITEEILSTAGYHRYEISNYALPGRECRHNLVYWQRGNYVGFGLGAASLVENVRFENTRLIREYLKNAGHSLQGMKNVVETESVHRLSVAEQMEETVFLGLRLTRGVSCKEFENTFGVEISSVYGDVIQKNMADGLLMQKDGFLFLTKEGLNVSNYVMAQFLL